jgi:molybdopterin molybdotransferase
MSEQDVSDLLTVAQAIEIIDATPVKPQVEQISLNEALGRILADDICSDRDYPPFDKSLMDGYAVRSPNVANATTGDPAILQCIGEIKAGQTPSVLIGPQQTMAIMTGAPLPAGADAIVPVEDIVRVHEHVRITKPVAPMKFVARAGSDINAGRVILSAGVRFESAQLAAAATVGSAIVKVFARPRVAILATGDELVGIDQLPAGAQIRNSNSILMASFLQKAGCEVVNLGIVADDPQLIRSGLRRGLECDALIVSGGMSMGEYDYVPKLLMELGIELKITKLRIKPGKPFIFGTLARQDATPTLHSSGVPEEAGSKLRYVFGLPGNPVSSFVCMARLVSRLLARLAGRDIQEYWIAGELRSPLGPNGPREFYQSAVLHRSNNDQIIVEPLVWKGSADLFTLAAANGLLVRPENEPEQAIGSLVRVMPL